MNPKSETETCRPYLDRFVQGDCLDIGFGGDPIVENAILVDLKKFDEFGDDQLQIDAQNLSCFEDGMFSTVYSSHLLEDFQDTQMVLKEWIRVLALGGNLILFLPNQMAYEAHCKEHGTQPNQDHKHKHFCFEYVVARLPANMNVIHFENPVTYNPYSFAIVAQKMDGVPQHTLMDVVDNMNQAKEQKRAAEISKQIIEASAPRVWTPDDLP